MWGAILHRPRGRTSHRPEGTARREVKRPNNQVVMSSANCRIPGDRSRHGSHCTGQTSAGEIETLTLAGYIAVWSIDLSCSDGLFLARATLSSFQAVPISWIFVLDDLV